MGPVFVGERQGVKKRESNDIGFYMFFFFF